MNVTVATRQQGAEGGDRPLTILRILETTLMTGSRQDTANRLNIAVGCLDYLELSLPEVSLFLLNMSDDREITFDEAFRGVFVSEVESVLRKIVALRNFSQSVQLVGNETLHQIALTNNRSVETESILDILIQPFNVTVRRLSLFLEINVSSFDLLDRSTKELAAILAVENPDDLKNYSLLHLAKISILGNDFLTSLQVTIRSVRASLHLNWTELVRGDLENVTSVLELVLVKVPRRVLYLKSFIIGPAGYDLNLLNVTLQEIALQTNISVVELQSYKVYPTLVELIFKTNSKIMEINGETKKEVEEAVTKILEAYNVTILQLSKAFSLTVVYIRRLSPLKIEVLCARFTLIRYVSNLNLTISEAAVRVNRTDAELTDNLTVSDFHVVIRRLVVFHAFEVMSQMLGVSQQFLINSLQINVPISTLTMCQLDGFLNTTRHTVLSLREVISTKSLAFVTQMNGFSITFVRKLTIYQFITQVMHLSVDDFFTLSGITSGRTNRLQILIRYNFFFLGRLFKIHGDIPNYPFAIFRFSCRWIVHRIIFLVERGE